MNSPCGGTIIDVRLWEVNALAGSLIPFDLGAVDVYNVACTLGHKNQGHNYLTTFWCNSDEYSQ